MLLIDAKLARKVVGQIRTEFRQAPDLAQGGHADAPEQESATHEANSGKGTVMRPLSCTDEPFAHYMQSQGFDPDDGCVLYLPETLRWNRASETVPQYVEFVAFTDDLLLIRNPA